MTTLLQKLKKRAGLYILYICTIILTVYWVVKLMGLDPRPFLSGPQSLRNATCICLKSEIDAETSGDWNSSTHTAPGLFQTTCSPRAYRRGQGQKVISFVYYSGSSDESRYFDGIQRNFELMPKLYPGWTMRIYVDEGSREFLDICPITEIGLFSSVVGRETSLSSIFPMLWRYLPALDYQVETFLSRDIDSNLNVRERAAVQEWQDEEGSDLALHVMRDHPCHLQEVMGGMFGLNLTRGDSRRLWKDSWAKMVASTAALADRTTKGPDQDLLRDYVWDRWGSSRALQHDSFNCNNFTAQKSLAWPTRRWTGPNNFVGAPYKYLMTVDEPCPEVCRRHQHWTLC